MRHAQHLGLVFLSIMALGNAALAMPAGAMSRPASPAKAAAIVLVDGRMGGGGGARGGGAGAAALGGAIGGLIGGLMSQPEAAAPPPAYYAPPPDYYPPPAQSYAPPPIYVAPAPVASTPYVDNPPPDYSSAAIVPPAPSANQAAYQAADQASTTLALALLGETVAATPAPSDPAADQASTALPGALLGQTVAPTPPPNDAVREAIDKIANGVDLLNDHQVATAKAIWEVDHQPPAASSGDGSNVDMRNLSDPAVAAKIAYQQNSSDLNQMSIIQASHEQELAAAQQAQDQGKIQKEQAWLDAWNANIFLHAPAVDTHNEMLGQRNIMLPGSSPPGGLRP